MTSPRQTEPDFDALRGRSLTSIHHHHRRHRMRVQIAAWSAAAAVVAGTTGAVWMVLASDELQQHSAACYDEQTLNSRHSDIGSAEPGTMSTTELAIAMCETSWRMGVSGPEGSNAPPDGLNLPVPRLFACLQANGVTAVFPYENGARRSCEELGLGPPRP